MTLDEVTRIIDMPCNMEFFNKLSISDRYFTEKRTLASKAPFSYIKNLWEMR
jgi:hypothetical protein